MADFVIADSNATATVLVADVPAFAVLKAYSDGFKAAMKKDCSACMAAADGAFLVRAGGGRTGLPDGGDPGAATRPLRPARAARPAR